MVGETGMAEGFLGLSMAFFFFFSLLLLKF